MAIGSSTSSPSLSSLRLGPGTGTAGSADVPLGLRGAVSLGSGLRTGVTVVNRAVQTAGELNEARQIAREALLEQARREQEADAAEEAAARLDPARAETVTPAQPVPTPLLAAPDEAVPPVASEAAAAAGQTGNPPPRGAFVDLSI